MDTQEKNMKIETLQKEFRNEARKIFAWEDTEIAKIDEELKAKGLYRTGLDANSEYYAPVSAKAKAKMKALVEKYRAMADELEKNNKTLDL